MKISNAIKPLVVAGFAAMPVGAQTPAPSFAPISEDAVYAAPTTSAGRPYCYFAQTSKTNLISSATVFTGPVSVMGVSLGKGDTIYEFPAAEYVVQSFNSKSMAATLLGGRPNGEQQAQYVLTLATETPPVPSLLDRCLKAQVDLAKKSGLNL